MRKHTLRRIYTVAVTTTWVFAVKRKLAIHQRTNTGEEPYNYCHCNKAFGDIQAVIPTQNPCYTGSIDMVFLQCVFYNGFLAVLLLSNPCHICGIDMISPQCESFDEQNIFVKSFVETAIVW